MRSSSSSFSDHTQCVILRVCSVSALSSQRILSPFKEERKFLLNANSGKRGPSTRLRTIFNMLMCPVTNTSQHADGENTIAELVQASSEICFVPSLTPKAKKSVFGRRRKAVTSLATVKSEKRKNPLVQTRDDSNSNSRKRRTRPTSPPSVASIATFSIAKSDGISYVRVSAEQNDNGYELVKSSSRKSVRKQCESVFCKGNSKRSNIVEAIDNDTASNTREKISRACNEQREDTVEEKEVKELDDSSVTGISCIDTKILPTISTLSFFQREEQVHGHASANTVVEDTKVLVSKPEGTSNRSKECSERKDKMQKGHPDQSEDGQYEGSRRRGKFLGVKATKATSCNKSSSDRSYADRVKTERENEKQAFTDRKSTSVEDMQMGTEPKHETPTKHTVEQHNFASFLGYLSKAPEKTTATDEPLPSAEAAADKPLPSLEAATDKPLPSLEVECKGRENEGAVEVFFSSQKLRRKSMLLSRQKVRLRNDRKTEKIKANAAKRIEDTNKPKIAFRFCRRAPARETKSKSASSIPEGKTSVKKRLFEYKTIGMVKNETSPLLRTRRERPVISRRDFASSSAFKLMKEKQQAIEERKNKSGSSSPFTKFFQFRSYPEGSMLNRYEKIRKEKRRYKKAKTGSLVMPGKTKTNRSVLHEEGSSDGSQYHAPCGVCSDGVDVFNSMLSCGMGIFNPVFVDKDETDRSSDVSHNDALCGAGFFRSMFVDKDEADECSDSSQHNKPCGVGIFKFMRVGKDNTDKRSDISHNKSSRRVGIFNSMFVDNTETDERSDASSYNNAPSWANMFGSRFVLEGEPDDCSDASQDNNMLCGEAFMLAGDILFECNDFFTEHKTLRNGKIVSSGGGLPSAVVIQRRMSRLNPKEIHRMTKIRNINKEVKGLSKELKVVSRDLRKSDSRKSDSRKSDSRKSDSRRSDSRKNEDWSSRSKKKGRVRWFHRPKRTKLDIQTIKVTRR